MANVYMMDSTYQDLADRALKLLETSQKYRVLILLIGAPGSGKTTVARRVVDILNNKHRASGNVLIDDLDINETSCLETFNDLLPTYKEDDVIDYEAEDYVPTIQKTDNDIIIRGRGGDLTSIKITNSLIEHKDDDLFAQVIPMDGFHLPRAILRKFKDSDNAFERRGSPFTFDSSLIVKLVENVNETLKVPIESNVGNLDIMMQNTSKIPNIFIPDFNHSEHDPNQFGCHIHSTSRILIMEGLYLLLDNPIWNQIPKVLDPNIENNKHTNQQHEVNNKVSQKEGLIYNDINDIPITPIGKSSESWKILIDDKKMLKRVSKRHLKAGIVNDLKDGEERVKNNDLPNGAKIYRESFHSDLNIISIDDINEETK